MRRFYKHCFRRDLALGALEAAPDWPPLEGAPPEAILQAMRAAWDASDTAAVIVLGRRLRDLGALEGVAAMRLRRALLSLGLFAEALALIVVDDAPADRERMHQATLALCGLDRLKEARGVIGEARRLNLASPELDGLEPLLSGAAATPALIGQALSSGLTGIAVEELCSLFRAGRPQVEADLIEALDLVRCALRLADPGQGRRLLEAVGPLYGPGEDRAAWDGAAQILAGGADDGAFMVAPADEPVRHRLGYILAAACAAHRAWPAAIARFGRAVARLPRQDEHFYELARCIEADLRERTPLRLARDAGRRRIIDVSPFNGEFTLLEIKLNEMAAWVDTFVIYEARRTYTGLPKPLHFAEGRGRFAAFEDKIVHVVLDEAPPYASEAWARELYQRASAAKALSGLAGPDDLVMMTDTDEVLDGARTQAFEGLYACCGLRTFCWFLNLRLLEPVKQGAKSCLIRGRFALGAGTAYTRLGLGALAGEILPETGWHFTSVLTPEDLKIKLDSYSHEDWAGSSVAEQDAFLRAIREGRVMPGYERQVLDSSFPRYVLQEREALAQFIL
jgi:hypothetical protein